MGQLVRQLCADVRAAFFGNLQMDFLMGKWPLLKKGGVTVAKEGLKKGGWGDGGGEWPKKGGARVAAVPP